MKYSGKWPLLNKTLKCAALVFLEAIYFIVILSKEVSPEKSDLIIVLPGSPKRIEAAYNFLRF